MNKLNWYDINFFTKNLYHTNSIYSFTEKNATRVMSKEL